MVSFVIDPLVDAFEVKASQVMADLAEKKKTKGKTRSTKRETPESQSED